MALRTSGILAGGNVKQGGPGCQNGSADHWDTGQSVLVGWQRGAVHAKVRQAARMALKTNGNLEDARRVLLVRMTESWEES